MNGTILRLRLARPLVYARGTMGDEWIESYALAGSRYEDEEGPHPRSPLPHPFFSGGAAIRAGTEDPKALPEATGPSPDGDFFIIGTEAIAIAQYDGAASSETCLNAFLRDAWWAGILVKGPLILRRLREDGKEALQWLSPADFPEERDA